MFRSLSRLAVAGVLLAAQVPAQLAPCSQFDAQTYNDFLSRVQMNQYTTGNLPVQPDPLNPIVVSLAFHSINTPNGTVEDFRSADASDMLTAVKQAFVGTGIDFTNTPTLLTQIESPLSTLAADVPPSDNMQMLLGLYQTPDAIDVFLVDSLQLYSAGLRGIATVSLCDGNVGVVVDKHFTPNGTFYSPGTGIDTSGVWVHELGHYFDLIHPSEEWMFPPLYAADCPGDVCIPNQVSTTGDFVCDTPAAPDPLAYFPTNLYPNCVYSPPVNPPVVTQPQSACPNMPYSDPMGVIATNWMTLQDPTCRSSFTPGQVERMFASMINFRPELYDHCLAGNASLFNCDPAIEFLTPASGNAGTAIEIAPNVEFGGVDVLASVPDQRILVFHGDDLSDVSNTSVIIPNDPLSVGRFGAALSGDGDTLLVGIPDGGPGGSGRVFSHVRHANGDYTPNQSLDALVTGPVTNDFGVALDHYGDWAVIGVNDKEASGVGQVGLAYVYDWDPSDGFMGEWGPIPNTTLRPADFGSLLPSSDLRNWGGSVAISGKFIVLGASKAPRLDDTDPRTGAVFVWRRAGSTWQPFQMISPDVGSTSFGWDVDIWGDTIVVGAPDDNVLGMATGSVSIYTFDAATQQFERDVRITNPENQFSSFGDDVAIGHNLVVVGDPGFGAGRAYTYERRPFNQWQVVGVNNPVDSPFDFDQGYGESVAATRDGYLVGAPRLDRLPFGGSVQVDAGGLYAFPYAEPAPGTLSTSGNQMSASAGGQVVFSLDFGVAAAGQSYAVGGTFSGTEDGQTFFFQGASPSSSAPHETLRTVLDKDSYFDLSSTGGGSPLLLTGFGMLDANGQANVTFFWPQGFLAGSPDLPLTFTHIALLPKDRHYETAQVDVVITP